MINTRQHVQSFPRAFRLFAAAAAIMGFYWQAAAWHCDGHYNIAGAAADIVEDSIPDFFIDQRDIIVQSSCDPDMFRQKWAEELRSTEASEHYIDLEYLGDMKLPSARRLFEKACAEKGVDPHDAGFLPYAIVEWAQRLSIAFAQCRAWPDNSEFQAKCAVYAGILAHYCADLCQPLHTTVHFDGRVKNAGEASPQTGIHSRVDALAGRLDWQKGEFLDKIVPVASADMGKRIRLELEKSARLVDSVYALEKKLPLTGDTTRLSSDVEKFASRQSRAAIQLLADLYYTAWTLSGAAELPQWFGPYRSK